MILVSPAERIDVLRTLGPSSQVAEHYGADFLIITRQATVAVQRKEFPGDLLSSLADGRLSASLRALTQAPIRLLVLEGRPAWTDSGVLVGWRGQQFNRRQLRSLLMSAAVELGVSAVWTDSPVDTADYIRTVETWAEKPEHQSLFRRPGAPHDDYGREAQGRDRAAWILQGFPGVGYGLATKLFDHFGRLPLRWTVTERELAAVPGVGKERLRMLTEFVPPAPAAPDADSPDRPKRRKKKEEPV